jgi:hypothetical protein
MSFLNGLNPKSNFLAAPLKATASERHGRNGVPNTSFIRVVDHHRPHQVLALVGTIPFSRIHWTPKSFQLIFIYSPKSNSSQVVVGLFEEEITPNTNCLKGYAMKLIKSLAAIGCASFLLAGAAFAAEKSCCEKAAAEGKDCTHPCCVEAKKAGKTCEKCNPKKVEEKK